MTKYKAVPCEIDGHKFPSLREGKRYRELIILQRVEAIKNLELQPKYQCVVNGKKVCEYRADFSYYDLVKNCQVVEDCKGFKTPVYRLKKKLVESLYGFTILET